MGITVAVIPARAGSKGIANKNLLPLCGHPLIAWSIHHAKNAVGIDSVWVSSDGDEILRMAQHYGAHTIKRPESIAGDTASSESAWHHAIDVIESKEGEVARVIGVQPTSPLREPRDLTEALERFERDGLDSLLSVTEVEDFFTWKLTPEGEAQSVNYDWRHRRPRQHIEKRYLENGSFYIFTPNLLRADANRLGGNIGLHVMARHKMFQIDNPEDVRLCEAIMRGYELDRL